MVAVKNIYDDKGTVHKKDRWSFNMNPGGSSHVAISKNVASIVQDGNGKNMVVVRARPGASVWAITKALLSRWSEALVEPTEPFIAPGNMATTGQGEID
jgi:hypothetical protein